jgi:hypothetical protein
MNHTNKLHPFALRAVVLSILITSTMALLPSLAAVGSQKPAHEVQTLEAANTTVRSTQVAG